MASVASSDWEPLLSGPEAERAREIVSETVAKVCDAAATKDRVLLGGAGRAMFLAYAGAAGLADHASASNILEAELVALPAAGRALGLWHGYAGLRWVLSHLSVGAGASDALACLDSVILAGLEERPWRGTYDLSDGVAGVALAFSEPESALHSRILQHALDHLESWTATRDFGCAHGVAGVVGVAAMLVKANAERDRGSRLLARTVRLLLRHEVAPAPTKVDARRSVSWCNGETGIALVLMAAARAMANEEWEQASVTRALRLSARAREEELADACVCHGLAGIAHALNRFYQATRCDALRSAAVHFLHRTMEMGRPHNGSPGISIRRPIGEGAPSVDDTSLLTGSAGVGLVLLAAISNLPPTWDRVLLADF